MCVIMATVLAPSHLNVFIFILFGFGNMVHAYTVKAPRRWVREGRRSGLRASIRNKRDECESSLAGGNVSFTSYLAPLLFFFSSKYHSIRSIPHWCLFKEKDGPFRNKAK